MPAARSGPDPSTAARDARRLSTLLEVSQALSGTLNLKAAMQRVLQTLIRHHSVVRGMVTLLREGELQVEAIEGFEDRARSIRIKLGEGITGKVVESGKPIVVPRVSKEPTFLNLAPRRLDHQKHELTFICVPIMLNRQAVGALAVDLRFKAERDYDSSVKFFGIASSMIGQALNVQRMVEEERRRLLDENTHLRQELRERYDFSNIIGTSGPTRQMYEQVAQVAQTNTTVLIRGESGTGKELIAHAIHYNSLRAKKPFVKVSCAALPDTLIESELFGYEKGAFTGANTRKKGRFEMAEGGTLFLDEIGDVNLSTQVKLLRVLQEREFERLGGTETVKVNVRLIAATNKDLKAMVAEGAFREDLYYRINIFPIRIPPLRERRDDIPALAFHFLKLFSKELEKPVAEFSEGALNVLMNYDWPGNVRELENTVHRAVILANDKVIRKAHLVNIIEATPRQDLEIPRTSEESKRLKKAAREKSVEEIEKLFVLETLKRNAWNVTRSAEETGMQRANFQALMKKHGIRVREAENGSDTSDQD